MKLDKSIQISSMYLFSSPKGSRVLGHLGKVDCQALVCLVWGGFTKGALKEESVSESWNAATV